MFEDIVHTTDVLLRTGSLVYTSKPLWNYRICSGSISHGKTENLYDAIKARDLRYAKIRTEKPNLVPILKQEYVNAFFYVMNILSSETGCRSTNRECIKRFYWDFCRKESISLSLRKKRDLLLLYIRTIIK